jgi:hypothetical protein
MSSKHAVHVHVCDRNSNDQCQSRVSREKREATQISHAVTQATVDTSPFYIVRAGVTATAIDQSNFPRATPAISLRESIPPQNELNYDLIRDEMLNDAQMLTCEMVMNLQTSPFKFFEGVVAPPTIQSSWLDHWMYRAQTGNELSVVPVPSTLIVPESRVKNINL